MENDLSVKMELNKFANIAMNNVAEFRIFKMFVMSCLSEILEKESAELYGIYNGYRTKVFDSVWLDLEREKNTPSKPNPAP